MPDPVNPQSLNRYTYNNPIRFTESIGHCPKPSDSILESHNNVICIAGFIPTSESTGPVGITYAGDGRTFSSDSNPEASRFWVWIDADTGEILNPEEYVNEEGIYFHPTVTIETLFGIDCLFACTDQPTDRNHFSINKKEDGSIKISYSILCSYIFCHAGFGPDGRIDLTTDVASFDTSHNMFGPRWLGGKLIKTFVEDKTLPNNNN